MLGYCMGGTLAASYAALHPEQVRTLTLLAAPIDFSGRESLLNLWTRRRTFDVDAFIDTHGNCPGWFLQTSFLWLIADSELHRKDDRAATSRWKTRARSPATSRWNAGSTTTSRLRAKRFASSSRSCIRTTNSYAASFHIGGRHVDLAQIVCPLLLLTAKNDHLVPPSSTEGIRRRVGSRDVKSLTIGAGHVGLVVGGKAQATIWPEATRWLAERSKTNDEGRGVRARDFVVSARNEQLPPRP